MNRRKPTTTKDEKTFKIKLSEKKLIKNRLKK